MGGVKEKKVNNFRYQRAFWNCARGVDTNEVSMVMCYVRNHAAEQEEAVKWRDLYSGLMIREQEDQPDCDAGDYFQRMVNATMFALDPFHTVDDEAGNFKTIRWAEQPINVTIRQALVTAGYQHLELTCKTVGVLPPGIVHGTYVLKFDDVKDCYELPAEMFKDEEIPEDELEHWSERVNDDKP